MRTTQLRAGLLGIFLSWHILQCAIAAPICSRGICSTSNIPSHDNVLHPLNRLPTFNVGRKIYASPVVQDMDSVIRRGFFDSIVNAFKGVGNTIVQKVGGSVKHEVQKAEGDVKTVVKDVKKTEKTAVKFVKTNGPMVEKVALKSVATAAEASSKLVGLVPGLGILGKPLGFAMNIGGKELNKVSNNIHAKTPQSVNDAMKKMNKAQKILSFIPREAS